MSRSYKLLLFCILIHTKNNLASIITTLNNNDPVPIFTSAFPYDYLYVNEKENMKGRTKFWEPRKFSLAISPFFQTANKGNDIYGEETELGNLKGKWNMIALMPFGPDTPTEGTDVPAGYEIPPLLYDIRDKLIREIQTQVPTDPNNPTEPIGRKVSQLNNTEGLLSLQDSPRLASEELFGYFSVPIKYRKTGVRFEMMAKLFGNFGFAAQTGVANISQVADFNDQITCNISPECISNAESTCPNNFAAVTCMNPFATPAVGGSYPYYINDQSWDLILNILQRELMNELPDIANAIELDICNYNETKMEDFYIDLFWRKAYYIDEPGINDCLTSGLVIPFITIGGSIPTTGGVNSNKQFALPFGNNGHYSVRFDAGISYVNRTMF